MLWTPKKDSIIDLESSNKDTPKHNYPKLFYGIAISKSSLLVERLLAAGSNEEDASCSSALALCSLALFIADTFERSFRFRVHGGRILSLHVLASAITNKAQRRDLSKRGSSCGSG